VACPAWGDGGIQIEMTTYNGLPGVLDLQFVAFQIGSVAESQLRVVVGRKKE